jgi:GINS complex subunit 4
MDIDDILADIDRDAVPQENVDLQALTRSWVAERVAPELLPYPDELMERVLERIAKQVRQQDIPTRGDWNGGGRAKQTARLR